MTAPGGLSICDTPAGVAQLEAQAICNRQVVGSSPTTGTRALPLPITGDELVVL